MSVKRLLLQPKPIGNACPDLIQEAVSTIGTGTSNLAFRLPAQHKTFYANGRFWVFYYDGTGMYFSSKVSGGAWDAPTMIAAVLVSGAYFAIYYDAPRNHVHYVRWASAPITAMRYRRGTPQADGTITWSAVEQAVNPDLAADFGICVDSEGYPFISYPHLAFDPFKYPRVTRSDNNDGTYVETAGYPIDLVARERFMPQVLPLLEGRIYAVYARAWAGQPVQPIYGRLYDGAVWQPEEQVTALNVDTTGHSRWSMTSASNDVHLVFLEDTSNDITYVRRRWGIGWEAPEDVETALDNSISPVISHHCEGSIIYVFWMGNPVANHIYYRRRNGTWGAQVDWYNEVQVIPDNQTLAISFRSYSRYIALTWPSTAASPFNLRHACIP